MWFEQSDYDVRLDWGTGGLEARAPATAVVVIGDVLSLWTCVDVAVSHGALVYPFADTDDAAAVFATRVGAVCARRRGEARYSLSPRSFTSVERGARVVLPSPNGGALALRTGQL